MISATDPSCAGSPSQGSANPHAQRPERADANHYADCPSDFFSKETEEESRLSKALEEIRLVTGANGAAIAMVRGDQMVCCATSGDNVPDLWTQLDPDNGLTGRCMRTRELQQSLDTERDPRVNLEACRRLEVRSIVVVPLTKSDELLGICEILSSRPDAFSPGDLESLKELTSRILESNFSQRGLSAIEPGRECPADSIPPEVPVREIVAASTLCGSAVNHSSYWMAIRTISIVALCVLLGWMVGNADWKMAVARAENQSLTSASEIGPLAEQAALDKPEAAAFSQTSIKTLQPSVTVAVMPAEISLPATEEQVKPEYPADAQRQHLEGKVSMKVLVGIDGKVRDVIAIDGDPQLAQAASEAIRNWNFRPQSDKGQPVEFEAQITITFALTS